MDPFVIATIWAALIATGIWESSVEGRDAWAQGKSGWNLSIGGFILTRYHFFLFWIMFPLLLSLPLIVAYSHELLRSIVFAYSIGLILEDLAWFASNPHWGLARFTPKDAPWHAWMHVGPVSVPIGYVIGVVVALAALLV